MVEYRERIADAVLKKKLRLKGAVLIQGAKWTGKTTTAKQTAGSVVDMTESNNLLLAQIDPVTLISKDPPVLIDEWQLVPTLWDTVRTEVDRRGEKGQFILTGSSVPVSRKAYYHSGVGRITRMTMRPMSLYESGDSSGTVSLSGLFDSDYTVSSTADMNIRKLTYLISRGGWPEMIGLSEEDALEVARDYTDGIIQSDLDRSMEIETDKEITRSILLSYARHIGSQVRYEEIRKDVTRNELDTLSISTVYRYVNALKNIFIIEDAECWSPKLRSRTVTRTTETRYFVDPAIAVAVKRIGPKDLINDLETTGFLFENLVMRDLRVYAESIDGEVYHYRDTDGDECDAVVHLHDGRYGLIEVKLGDGYLTENGVKSLNRVEAKLDTDRMNPPSFKMVIVGVGKYAYRRPDGICVVPISCLKP